MKAKKKRKEKEKIPTVVHLNYLILSIHPQLSPPLIQQ